MCRLAISRLPPSRRYDMPGLRFLIPQTMAGVVAAGCLIAAAPLLAAVVLASGALERLSRHSELLIEDGVALAQLGAELRDDLNNLERSARQYAALRDPALLEVFFSRVLDVEDTLKRIEQKRFQAPLAAPLLHVREGLNETTQGWIANLKRGAPLNSSLERIRALHGEAERITDSGREAINAQVHQLREASLAARRVTLISSAALVPLTALLALGFSLAITRPLRRLGQAIAALGHARYQQPIRIGYPREMHRLGERLDWLRCRLAQLEADKDRFLRHVSHELKTPLASLREGTNLLSDGSLGALTPSQMEVAEILAESAEELHAQILNLLAFAEWRHEDREGAPTWFDAQPLVEEVLNAQKLSLVKRSLRAELDLQSPRLFGQRARLRVALDNLVTNAVKHAAAGTAIEIMVAVRDETCELSVRDSGRGVPDADKGRIFEPFVRGSEVEEAGVRGTGIGLSIVRETVQAHGGKVEVEDAHPGARFRLTWPCPQHGAESDVADCGLRDVDRDGAAGTGPA